MKVVKLTAMKLLDLAAKTGARIEGETDIDIIRAVGLDQAGPGQVTFLSNPRYTSRVKTTRASAIFVGEDTNTARTDIALLRAKHPYPPFTRALIHLAPSPS